MTNNTVNEDEALDEIQLNNACPLCGAISLVAHKTHIGYYLRCTNNCPAPFSRLIKTLLAERENRLLDRLEAEAVENIAGAKVVGVRHIEAERAQLSQSKKGKDE